MTTIATSKRGRPARTWDDIATIPDDHRDGRDVLLWAGYLVIASWCDGWRDTVGREIAGVSAWADVEGPGT
jgi:hypothetical protein